MLDKALVRIYHPMGSLQVLVLRNIFGNQLHDINQTLTESTTQLHAAKPASNKKRTERDEAKGRAFHFGCWRKYCKEPITTDETLTHPYFETWNQLNASVFEKVDAAFKQHWPLLHMWYRLRQLPFRFGAFATVVVNVNFACGPHVDGHDCRNGLCFVLVFGQFTGGSLCLEGLKTEIDCQPGDLIVFPSQKLRHWVTNFEGWRSSLVFLSHDSIFFPPKK